MSENKDLKRLEKIKALAQKPSMWLIYGGGLFVFILNFGLIAILCSSLAEIYDKPVSRFLGLAFAGSLIAMMIPSVLFKFDSTNGLSSLEKGAIVGMLVMVFGIQGMMLNWTWMAEYQDDVIGLQMNIVNILVGIGVDLISGALAMVQIQEIVDNAKAPKKVKLSPTPPAPLTEPSTIPPAITPSANPNSTPTPSTPVSPAPSTPATNPPATNPANPT